MPTNERTPRRPQPRKHQGETVSEYFNPEKGEQIVRRNELMAILSHIERSRGEVSLWGRFKRGVQKYYIASARAPVADEVES